MAINYFSPVRLTLALLPAMLERGSGHVVNVSSMGAHMISWGTSAYAASKGALELFTEALYLELAPRGACTRISSCRAPPAPSSAPSGKGTTRR